MNEDPRIAIRAEGLSAGYGSKLVLDDVSFEIGRRRVSVVVGPGGGGKTTLLRALCGEPGDGFWYRGELHLSAGRPMTVVQKPSIAEGTLGELFVQSGISRGELESFWGASPDAAGRLSAWWDRPSSELPTGLLRLALVTTAARTRASCLLLDEPEIALDDDLRAALAAKIRALGSERTVVVVTHHLRFARAIADDAMLLLDGQMIEAGPAAQFFACPSHPRTRHYVRLGG